jgi:hypothetical protein
MAIIPADEKVFMVDKRTNTTYGGSQALQDMQQWYTMQDVTDSIRPYKVYTALVSQSGTDAPTAVILENTFGQIPTWSRDFAGQYALIFTGDPLTENKTIPPPPTINSSDKVLFNRLITKDGSGFGSQEGYFIYQRNTDIMYIRSLSDVETFSDDILENTPIEIRVYN